MSYLLIASTLLSFSVSQGRTAVDHIYYGYSQNRLEGSFNKSFTTYNLLILLFQQALVPTSAVCLRKRITLILYSLMGDYARNEIFVM